MALAAIMMALVLQPTPADSATAQFMGNWHGDSSCVATGTACRDETVAYHIAKLPEKPGYLSVTAEKIVNGKAINMGTLEFHYDQAQHMLVCEYPQGVWRFKLNGGNMEGTLTRPGNTIFRRVTLRKDP
jgi:hypothetical protein